MPDVVCECCLETKIRIVFGYRVGARQITGVLVQRAWTCGQIMRQLICKLYQLTTQCQVFPGRKPALFFQFLKYVQYPLAGGDDALRQVYRRTLLCR